MDNPRIGAGRKIAQAAVAAALAAAAAAAIAGETIGYGYDARGRLVRIDHGGTVNANVVTNYSYDKADNRTVRNTTGVP